MAGDMAGYPTSAGSSGGQKRKGETPTGGGWYRLYGKLFVCQTGPRAVQAVLQLHPALDLLYHRTVRQSVRIPEFWPTVLGVLLLGVV